MPQSDSADKTFVKAEVVLYCATANEPTLSDTDVGLVVDKAQRVQTWTANTALVIRPDLLIRPTVENGHWFRVVQSGTTHATTEPTWVTTKCGLTTDGTVIYQEAGPSERYAYSREWSIYYGWLLKAARAAHLVQIEGRQWQDVYEHCLQQAILFAPNGVITKEKASLLRKKQLPEL